MSYDVLNPQSNNGTAADAPISDSLTLHVVVAPLMPGVRRRTIPVGYRGTKL